MLKKTPTELDAKGSILFLGSGFTQSATNLRGTNPPIGHGLREEFAQLLAVDPNSYELQTLADEVASRADLNLFQILYELFTVAELRPDHEDILRLPWLRIYTSNFDDAAEFFYGQSSSRVDSFGFNDEKPPRVRPGSVVHLHGTIRAANSDNVLDQLVLNERSYVRQHYESSPWYVEFCRDLLFCTACYFVGYSLSDYHIAALLMQDPATRQKTYFVTKRRPDQIFVNRVRQYGHVLPIETHGFAELCRTLPAPTRSRDLYSLKAFLYLDPFKDQKTLVPPTANEVSNLVAYGAFNFQRCLSTLPKGEYVVARTMRAEEAAAELEDARCLLVHSRLGNGKTIFLYILAHLLSRQGYHCFWSRPNPRNLHEDLEPLQRLDKVAVFFDSYSAAVDLVGQLQWLPEDTKFIVAVRTGIQDVRLHEIQSKLPAPLARVGLNGIRPDEAENFKTLLDQAGLRVPSLEKSVDEARDFRDVVLTLYRNKVIEEKIKEEFAPLLESPDARKVFAVSHLLNLIGAEVEAGFVRTVTQTDPYMAIARFREIAGDMFYFDEHGVSARSAIFSEYLIQNHVETADVTDSVDAILNEAVKRKNEGQYRAIFGSLMKYSVLSRALVNEPRRIDALKNLYDRLRRTPEMNKEPLFWLQYGILMTDADDLKTAEKFIRTAYSRADDIPGFHTFQIDTFALKLFLLLERREGTGSSISRFSEIIEKIEQVRAMIGEANKRFHAVQVLEGIDPFVAVRFCDMSTEEKSAMLYHIELLVDSLRKYLQDEDIEVEAGRIRSTLLRARQRLTE